ncbi:MAG: hypothetical protein Q9217_002460 [Psora testacea]
MAPRLSYTTLSSYTYKSGVSPAGYPVSFALLKVEDLPPGVRECSTCGESFVVSEVSKRNPHRPLALDCGHVYCASCVFERVDFEMDAFQGCVDCDPKVSKASLLSSGSERVVRQQDWRALNGRSASQSGDEASMLSGSANSVKTSVTSRSTTTASSSLIADRLRTEEITNKVSMTNVRAVELLAQLTRHAERAHFKKQPSSAALKRALRTFNARYGSDLDLEELTAVLALTNMRRGSSLSVVEALSPWL